MIAEWSLLCLSIADNVGTVIDHILGMKSTDLAGEALNYDPCALIN